MFKSKSENVWILYGNFVLTVTKEFSKCRIMSSSVPVLSTDVKVETGWDRNLEPIYQSE